MTQTDFAAFDKAIKAAALALDVQLSAERIALYFEDLADYPIDAVVAALAKARRAQVYAGFPKAAEIIRHIEGTEQDRAELAWRTFCQLCTEQGHYPSIQVADGAMAYAIEHLGGWIGAQAKIADASPEMLRSYEHQFKTSYKLGAARNAEPRYFIGQFEAHNRTATYQPGREQIALPVAMVRADKFLVLSMPFDLQAGRLVESARESLTTGGESLRRYLPAPVPRKLNPAPIAPQEMASPEEIAELKAQIAALTGRQRLAAPRLPEGQAPANWPEEAQELLAVDKLPF